MTEQDEVAELLKRKQRLYDQLHADHIAAADQQLPDAEYHRLMGELLEVMQALRIISKISN